MCQNEELEKCPKSSKNGQNRDFKPLVQGNWTTRYQIIDVYCKMLVRSCYQERFHEKILRTLMRYSQKNLKIVDFVYITPPIIVKWQALRFDKVSKIICQKLSCPRGFGWHVKKIKLIAFAVYFHNFSTIRGMVPALPDGIDL